MRRALWLIPVMLWGCGPQTDELSSHLGMEREVIVTAGDTASVPLRVGESEVVQVRNGARAWADDVVPFDTPDREVIVTVRAADIIAVDGKAKDSTGNMLRKYLRAGKWQEPAPDRVPAKPVMLGGLSPSREAPQVQGTRLHHPAEN